MLGLEGAGSGKADRPDRQPLIDMKIQSQTPRGSRSFLRRAPRTGSLLQLLFLLATFFGAYRVEAQFTPGSGGSIPDLAPLTDPVGSIGGLRVHQTHRRNYTLDTGTHPELDLVFPPPSYYGATSYVLQRSIDGTTGWVDVPWNWDVLRTQDSNDNGFSFDPGSSFHYRLRVEGGPREGQFSNVVFAEASTVDTWFQGWGVESNMFFTGIMHPWVGNGTKASFTVENLADYSKVTGGISLQWYRSNPKTGEMTLIPGATNDLYVSTMDDVGGWDLICRATGDGTTVGGFIQIVAGGGVKIPNKAFASQFTEEGFLLNLFKSVPSLDENDLTLNYYDEDLMATVDVPIASVTPLTGNSSFLITVDLPAKAGEFYLSNESDVWQIGEEVANHPGLPPMMMEFLTIRNEPEITVMNPGTTPLTDNSGRLNFGTTKVKKRSAPKVFTIRNDGAAPLSGLSVRVIGADSKDFHLIPPGMGSLPPGASTTFSVTYKPRAKGTSKAKLLITNNDRNENPFDVNVIGRGKSK